MHPRVEGGKVSCCGVILAVALLADPHMANGQTAQPGETETAPAQTSPAAPDTRERQHHEAGSVEANGPEMQDRIFLRKAVAGGLTEIKLGQLADAKAASADVKQFGQRMVADHSQMNETFKPLADTMGVMLPTKLSGKDQALYERLNGLSGEEFDREYSKCMVNDHHTDLREFRTEAAATSDAPLRQAVERAAKTIREHMVAADALARAKGIDTTHSHGQPSAGREAAR